MPSSSLAPWPQEWSKAKTAKWYFSLAWLGILALIAFGGTAALIGGEYSGAAKYFVIFGVIFLVVIVVGYDSRVRTRKGGVKSVKITVDAQGRPASALPYSRIGFFGSALLMLLLTVLFALAATDFVLAVTAEDNKASLLGALIFGAIAVFFATYLFQVLRGRIALGRVLLTQQEIIHRSWGFESRLSWDNVHHISAIVGDGPEIWIRGLDGRVNHERLAKLWGGKPPRTSGIGVQSKSLGVDPAVVYYLLTFYFQQPSTRSELGTNAALQRVHTGAFF